MCFLHIIYSLLQLSNVRLLVSVAEIRILNSKLIKIVNIQTFRSRNGKTTTCMKRIFSVGKFKKSNAEFRATINTYLFQSNSKQSFHMQLNHFTPKRIKSSILV